jgi:type I restriction enzyme S subunit
MKQETLEKFTEPRIQGEQNFKQTEIGSLPEDWEVVRFQDAILQKRIKAGKIRRQEYKQIGKYPVIDQGRIFIAGYTDEDDKLYKGDLPVIIFGDHTRLFKFVNFPFVAGADGVKILLPNKSLFDPLFLYFALVNLKIESRGYNRHFPILKEKKIPLPPLDEQQKIARVLGKIQQAIEIQNRIIEQTKNLKKSLMQKLFTEGLYGEEQKETEVGKIPKSWKVVKLGEVYEFTKKPKNIVLSDFESIPFIPMEFISEEKVDIEKYDLKPNKKIKSGTFILKGDLIVAKITPSFENGKQGIVEDIPLDFAYATTEVWPLHGKKNVSSTLYLFYYLKKPDVRNEIAGKMEGATGRRRVPKSVLENLKIPFPSYHEQQQIAHILNRLDKKIEAEEKRKQVLKELFKTMLHKLMCGEIRLKEVEI